MTFIDVQPLDLKMLFIPAVGAKDIQQVYYQLAESVKGVQLDPKRILETA